MAWALQEAKVSGHDHDTNEILWALFSITSRIWGITICGAHSCGSNGGGMASAVKGVVGQMHPLIHTQ